VIANARSESLKTRHANHKALALVDPNEEILTTAEAAKLTKMSMSWFEKRRFEGRGGPPFRRRGRSIRYLKSELIAWFAAIRDGDFLGG
jgi:predicted DNA-binding transcriptional regulator AlpA